MQYIFHDHFLIDLSKYMFVVEVGKLPFDLCVAKVGRVAVCGNFALMCEVNSKMLSPPGNCLTVANTSRGYTGNSRLLCFTGAFLMKIYRSCQVKDFFNRSIYGSV